jgi:hypothetical protein
MPNARNRARAAHLFVFARLQSQALQGEKLFMHIHATGALLSAFFLLATWGCVGTASAQSLSCGGRLSGVGDSRFSVVQKCGEPVAKEFVCVPRPQVIWIPPQVPGAPPQQVVTQQCVPMEDWTFYRGEGNFLAIVRFFNGAVESVRDGEKAR